MAEIVVDRLEAVEVDEQAGELSAVRGRLPDRRVERHFEAGAVEEPCQVIGDRLHMVALFRRLQFRDVGHDGQRQGFTRFQRLHLLDQHVDQAAVGAAELHRDGGGFDILGGLPLAVLVGGTRRRIEKIGKVAAENSLAVVAGGEQPIVADCRQAIVVVDGVELRRREVVDARRLLVGALEIVFLLGEPPLHFVEIGGQHSHFVGGHPVHHMPRPEPARRLDGVRQAEQRPRHHHPVAQNCRRRDDHDRKQKDADIDGVVELEIGEEIALTQCNLQTADRLGAIDRAIVDGGGEDLSGRVLVAGALR
ncbi:hypothetical protein AB7M37_005148 [Sinorhizobium fredii]